MANALNLAPHGRLTQIDAFVTPDVTKDPSLLVLQAAHKLQLRKTALHASGALYAKASAVANIEREFPRLFDELATHLPGERGGLSCNHDEKHELEVRVFDRYRGRLIEALTAEPENFLSLLVAVHDDLGVGLPGLRDCAVGVRADVNDNRIIFPDRLKYRSILHEMFFYISAHNKNNPIISSAVLLVGILHAHPFTDGNGRTARVMYNLFLSEICGNEIYIPLLSLFSISRGGFLIKIRRAMYFGQWGDIVGYLLDATRYSRSV
jgi:hypothetical protein